MASVNFRSIFKRLVARKTEEPTTTTYHAVEIRCGKASCQAAQDSQRERFLSTEAPLLPLSQCDRPDQCDCRYQHYKDRRGGPRRRSEQGMSDMTDHERLERRYKNDRRAQDDDDKAEPFSVHKDSYHEHVGDTIRTATLKAEESEGIDPYDSGSFDKSKSWDR
jgi:hypothetical protein